MFEAQESCLTSLFLRELLFFRAMLSSIMIQQRSLRAAMAKSAFALPIAAEASLSSSHPFSRSCRNFSSQQRARRRKRPDFGIAKMEGTGPPKRFVQMGLDTPYSYGGEDGNGSQEYMEKTSLSPWVPIPDAVARKLFDMSEPSPDDVRNCLSLN